MPKRNILIDTNVFIASFKKGTTKSTELFITLIKDEQFQLICNEILLEEYKKYAKKLGPQSEQFFQVIKERCKKIAPCEAQIQQCTQYFNKSYADTIHAASCLTSNAILLTNDKDFDEIGASNVIEVWDIPTAIDRPLQ